MSYANSIVFNSLIEMKEKINSLLSYFLSLVNNCLHHKFQSVFR